MADDAKEKFDAHQFCMRWEGRCGRRKPACTRFVVRTDHALRLWVNDNRKAFIDGWVKSGSDTEYRASVFLLAGRAYPIRLEFSKAKQGVDDSKKNPNPPVKPAFVSLNWKRPNRAPEVIPARVPVAAEVPGSSGHQRSVPAGRSAVWAGSAAQVYRRSGTPRPPRLRIETASYVLENLNALSGTQPNSGDRATKIKTFCRTFAERAFRHPLSDSEKTAYIDRQFEAAGG